MKPHFLALSALLSLTAASAHGQSTDVEFSGQLVAATCVVATRANASGTGGPDAILQLPDVPDTQLAAAGARIGARYMQIVVGSAAAPCLAPSVQIGFRNGGNVNAAGRLSNTGTAKNVDIVLMDGNVPSAPLDINLNTNANSRVVAIPSGVGFVTLRYGAEYYATAPSTGGAVTTTIQYDVLYP